LPGEERVECISRDDSGSALVYVVADGRMRSLCEFGVSPEHDDSDKGRRVVIGPVVK
jgi:hypothetical protein